MTKPLLQAKSVSVTFRRGGLFGRGHVQALRGVDLSVAAGEIVAIVGESGSGKSTLGRCIAGLLRPTGGQLILDDEPYGGRVGTAVSASFRKDVQMVLQNPFDALNPVYTIAHHLARPLALHHQLDAVSTRARSCALLEQVELSPAETFLQRFPNELSGGQRQRATIARALAVQPRLIVADEPTSMLDIPVRRGVLQLFETIRSEQGIGVVLITHDIAAADAISDRIIVLKEGLVVEEGPSKQLIRAPQHPYTQALLAAIPRGLAGRKRLT